MWNWWLCVCECVQFQRVQKNNKRLISFDKSSILSIKAKKSTLRMHIYHDNANVDTAATDIKWE